jgi:tetratricopeptide (TPR) repeat protein
MEGIEKTVFLSYRRTNFAWALAIYKDLSSNGYDVFFDFTGIASGDFESVILANIRARAHFVVLLTPTALKRCQEPGDWVRLEIEAALDMKRNIVPVMLEGVDFAAPGIANQLSGRLSVLKSYNALRVPMDFFDEAMDRLRNRFLNVPLAAVLHPPSELARRASSTQKAAANASPKVEQNDLFAMRLLEQGFSSQDLDERVRLFTEAIRLNPAYPDVFAVRALARQQIGDLQGALQDYSEAIRIDPDRADLFDFRGITRAAVGDRDGALEDFNTAIRIDPDLADSFQNRGRIRCAAGDLEGGLGDFNEAIRLRPDLPEALVGRGRARVFKGDLEAGLRDFNEAIRLMPDCSEAWAARAGVRRDKGDLNGALLDYDELLRFEPSDAIALSNRGHVRLAKGDLEGALKDYGESLRLKPEYAKAFSGRAIVHLQRGDFEASLKDLNEAIRLDPDDADARFNRSKLRRFYAGDEKGARLDEREALRLGHKTL